MLQALLKSLTDQSLHHENQNTVSYFTEVFQFFPIINAHLKLIPNIKLPKISTSQLTNYFIL